MFLGSFAKISYLRIKQLLLGPQVTNTSATPVETLALNGNSRFEFTNSPEIRGLAQPAQIDMDTLVFLINKGTSDMTVKHESTGPTAVNRIRCPQDTDIILSPRGSVVLQYNNSASRWDVLWVNGQDKILAASNGMLAKTSAGLASRTISAGSAKVTITNGDGVAGNPSIDVVEAQLALNNISGTLSTSKGGTGVSGSASFPTSGTVATVPSSGVVKSNGTVLSASNVSLSTEVTGILPTANGGTGVNSTATFPTSGVVVTETAVQTLTNKVLTAADVDVYIDYDLENQPTPPPAGQVRVWASNVDRKMYKIDSNATVSPIEDGLNELPLTNYLRSYARAQMPPGTLGTVAANGNIATTAGLFYADATSGTSALTLQNFSTLRGSTYYVSALSGSDTAGGRFFQFPISIVEGSDSGKPVSVSFEIDSTLTSGNWDVVIASYDLFGNFQSLIPIAGTASASTSTPSARLPSGKTRFSGFFIAPTVANSQIALRFRRLSGSAQISLDTLYVGPQQQISSAAITDWQSYTPVLRGSTTDPTVSLNSSLTRAFWRRIGENICIYFVTNISSISGGSGELRFNLSDIYPGISFNTDKWLANDHTQSIGNSAWYDQSITTSLVLIPKLRTTNQFGLGIVSTSANLLVTQLAASDQLSFYAEIPISNWSSNVTMADRAVEEYASNSSTSTSGSDTTSFSNTSLGETIKSFSQANTDVVKRVRTSSVITATDNLKLEVSPGNDKWFEASSLFPYIAGNSARYGMTVQNVANSTDIDVLFGGDGAAPSTPWSGFTSWRWRIKKTSGGAAVGFPISSANIVGRTDGQAPASGMVGEQLVTTWSGVTVTGSATTLGTISAITPGIYLIVIEADAAKSISTRTTTAFGGTATLVVQKNATGGDFVQAQDSTSISLYVTYYARVTTSGSVNLQATSFTASTTGHRGSMSFVRIA